MMMKVKNMSEMKNEITFIVPCYNEEEYIRDCIRSIKRAASNIQYEIIVVDNNCTDNTSDIARDEGVIVLTEERKGVVFARQTGYENAKYDLIANIDADSRIPENWVDIALKHIRSEKVAAVTGPLVYDDASIRLRIATRIYYYLAYFSNLFIGVFLQGGNCLIKKKYLDELNGYDTSIAFYGEDTMTAKRLYKYGKIKFVMNLNLYSSSRRLQKQGVMKTTWLYLINYFYVTFRNKSYSNDYKDFR
jgi:glycosyltransferase involved in cell wall biosynthesis